MTGYSVRPGAALYAEVRLQPTGCFEERRSSVRASDEDRAGTESSCTWHERQAPSRPARHMGSSGCLSRTMATTSRALARPWKRGTVADGSAHGKQSDLAALESRQLASDRGTPL